jgi:hypothetical protein
MTGIGSVLNHQKKFAEALPLHEKALAMDESAFGASSPILASPLLGIGLAQLGLGHPARAVAPLERASKLAPVTRSMRGSLALTLAQALDGSGRADPRIRPLLEAARRDLSPVPKFNAKELAEIDRLLARH